jgi:hypothetical protein
VKRVQTGGSVDREHAIEVIEFVLEQLGISALGLDHVFLSPQVEKAHHDFVSALHSHEEVRV